MKNISKIRKVIHDLTDLPAHKLAYALEIPDMVKGIRLSFAHYGIEYTKEVHDELVEIVGGKLSGNVDLEHDWTEGQYENFVKFVPITEEV